MVEREAWRPLRRRSSARGDDNPIGYGPPVKRAELIEQTRRLVAEGQRLQKQPSLAALRTWLKLSDELLSAAWGSMDRYHLAWLMVGRSDAVRGRAMSAEEEVVYVRTVAEQKTAALLMSLKAVEEQHMPFLGETNDDDGPG